VGLHLSSQKRVSAPRQFPCAYGYGPYGWQSGSEGFGESRIIIMSDEGAFGIALTIAFLVVLSTVFGRGCRDTEVRNEAVRVGVAEYFISTNQTKEFRWKVCE
jgi:hypothetical protein